MKLFRKFIHKFFKGIDSILEEWFELQESNSQRRMALLHVRINGKCKTVFNVENKNAA